MTTDAEVLGQAADWLVLLHSGRATDADREAIRRWREASPAHARAWQRAEDFLGTLQQVPPDIGQQVLAPARPARRQVIGQLAVLLAVSPALWLAWREQPWQAWTAGLRTAVGEQRRITLPDSSMLTLNTDSAVDVDYSDSERRITLIRGEIHIATAPDPAARHRPLLVATPAGTAQALGTEFSVRRYDDRTHVAVFMGAVAIRPGSTGAGTRVVQAGEQAMFRHDAVLPSRPSAPGAQAWTRGMLIARQMPLADLLAELGRYRPGLLHCDRDVADIRVSGAFSLADTDHSLRLLADTFPVQIRYLTRYLVRVGPA